MSFFEKILNLFKPKSEAKIEPAHHKVIKNEGKVKEDLGFNLVHSKIKFSVKYKTTMINSITLSSDMKVLYLIDDNRAIKFPIDTDDGVLIGAIKGQLAVATALKPEEEEQGGGNDGAEAERAAAPSTEEVIKVETIAKQWTLTYNQRSRIVSFIGATDIDFNIRHDADCEEHRIDLNEKVVKIKRKGEELILTVYDR